MVNRNTYSICTADTSKDVTCKEIRSKLACSGSAADFVHLIYIVILNLPRQGSPADDFVVVPINVLSINGHIDLISEEIGYTCLIGTNVPHSQLLHWYNENVTYPPVIYDRRKLNPLSTSDTEEGQVPLEQQVIIWGDSNIPYLQQIPSPERIAESLARGIFFAKISAKIIETSQPLDLGTFSRF